MYKSGGKTFDGFLGKCRLKVVKLKDCKIKYGGSKTYQKKDTIEFVNVWIFQI